MNKSLKIAALMVVSAATLVLAAPTFSFTTSSKMNAMMKGSTIELSAYPKARLVFKSVTGSKATLVYQGTDAKGAFNFYAAAFKAEGWKTGEAMMAGGETMTKPADTMTKPTDTTASGDTKPADTMTKPADTMAGSETMKKDDATMGSAMMKDGTFQGHYNSSGHTLGISVSVKDGKTFAHFGVK
jgi:hypothetical protein